MEATHNSSQLPSGDEEYENQVLPEFCVWSRKKNKLKNKYDTEKKMMNNIYVEIT